MDEDLRNGLRWVLLTTEDTWETEMVRVLAPLIGDRQALGELRTFLEERSGEADPMYQPRMEAMIDAVSARIGGDPGSRPAVTELAMRYGQLDAEVEALETALAGRRAARAEVESQILSQLDDGQAVEFAGFRFERQAGGHAFEVGDRTRLTPAMCRMVPDLEAMQRYLAEHGESPPGVRASRRPPVLDVMRVV